MEAIGESLPANRSWSVTVRANWRVTFRFADRDVFDVDYLDYH
jgi:plasmid maintenance system killer protein